MRNPRRQAGKRPRRFCPVVFDVRLPERAAETEAEEEGQANESLDLLERTGRGVKDAGRKVGDLIEKPFD